ncbi:MAG: zinc-ribbon domain-containing protein [Myxococcota bacterium]
MIVECESCHTKFRLDEARISPTGAKVRCSRCKTAFIVQRPDASRASIIDEVVAEATNPGAPRAPEPTQDLFEGNDSSLSLGETGGELSSGEEKWEFDEDAKPQGGARKRPEPPPPPPATVESDDRDLDSLGAPRDWDLLGGGARELAADARFEAPPAPRPREPRARSERPAKRAAASRSVERALEAAVAAPAASVEEASGWARTAQAAAALAIESGMWIAAVSLCSIGLALAFSPRAETTLVETAHVAASLRGDTIEVSVTSLESAVGGVLTVVRGQLPPEVVARAPLLLRAVWVDAQGTAIGEPVIAGPPISHRELRELSIERLHAEHEAHARELRAGGAFEAIFPALPPGAKGVSLRTERAPVALPVATQESEATAAATASSRPTARPSSE